MNFNFMPEKTQQQQIAQQQFLYTEEQLMARLKFFIGICLALTLFGIVFVVLYSLIFVTQPLNAISPIDSKFFELIIPIATFLTGTLSGIMLAGNKKEDQEAMIQAQKLASDNFEATKKAMLNPVNPPATPTQSYGGYGVGTVQPIYTPQVVVNSTGQPMPTQPPHPEI